MREIYIAREDLQTAFGNLDDHNVRWAYTEWFLNNRDNDGDLLNLDEAYFTTVRQAYDKLAREGTTTTERVGRIKRRLMRKPSDAVSANKPDCAPLPKGVNLCGFIQGSFGLGEAVRILAEILEAGGIPFTVIEFQVGTHRFIEDQWNHKVSNEFIYNTNILLSSPNWLPIFMNAVDKSSFTNRYNIGYWFWELQEIPEDWLPAFDLVDEIWTASEFLRSAFQACTEKPVTTVPLSLSMHEIAPMSRKDFGLEEDVFIFLMTYDPYSISERKNPDATIRAFLQVFGGNDRVRLLIKYSERRSDSDEDRILSIAEKTSNIDIIEGVFPKEKMNALIRCCDVLVSLHRAEGFGLAPAEAMYLGKPVIMTNWSGNTEFMTADNCCPVDFEVIELKEDVPPYSKGDHWADPNVEHAAAYMKRLFEDRDYYEAISAKAMDTMRNQFSPEAMAKVLSNRLKELALI
ncbi:glycosyl transferase [Clostridia bacterium]|nr:glycosyl transferase [Clostridia bacterium]